jgi:TRAP-type uncharacterized transport system substrate-binding protein
MLRRRRGTEHPKAPRYGSPKGRMIKLDSALQGLGIPLHPGAEMFYREKGLVK